MNKQDHIGDERMVEVLDIGAEVWSEAEVLHLRNCSACTTLLEEYQRLYPQLAVLPLEVFPENFSQTVLDQLPESSRPVKDHTMSILWIGLGLMTVGILVGLQAFYQLFSGFGASLLELGASLGRETLQSRSFWKIFSSETVRLLLAIPFCFGAVGLLDWLIRRRHHPILKG